MSTSFIFFKRTFLLMLILNALAVRASFNASEICSLISNGTQIKDPRACNKWIECINLEPIEYSCGSGLFYDRNARECVPENSISCISSNPCATLTNGTSGFVPDPYSCSTYYYCANDAPSLGSCSTNWTYNPKSKTCVFKGNCSSTMDPDSYCNIVPDGIFIGLPDNCQDYQECWKGDLLNGTCPESLNFNAFNGLCTNIPRLECPSSRSTTVMATLNECTKDGQFLSDYSTCNGYYYCKQIADNQYNLIHGNCSPGFFFNASINDGECVIRTEVVCQYDRCVGLGYNKIQLSNLYDDGCKGYALCEYGQEIDTGLCPDNEYFDEVKQLCVTTVISYPACRYLSHTTTTPISIETTTQKSLQTTTSQTTVVV